MPYTKQTWVDNDPTKPLSAPRMNYLEDGVATAQSTAEGKAASAHTHSTADVSGLDTTLAGKAATSHTHGVTDLTATGTKSATTFLRGDNTWAEPPGAGGGVSDHGALTGLTDDDHTQYHTDARGDVRYYTKAVVDTALAGKAPTTHTHTATQVSDSTAVGRAVLTAPDALEARNAIGAGTSNLALGTTGTTAKAGDYAPPTSSTTVQGLVELATTAEATTGTDAVRAVTPAGLKAVADTKAPTAHSHTFAAADLPAGSTMYAAKVAGAWPARPTSRTDVVVFWIGAEPSPSVVGSGTGGMLAGDVRLVTP